MKYDPNAARWTCSSTLQLLLVIGCGGNMSVGATSDGHGPGFGSTDAGTAAGFTATGTGAGTTSGNGAVGGGASQGSAGSAGSSTNGPPEGNECSEVGDLVVDCSFFYRASADSEEETQSATFRQQPEETNTLEIGEFRFTGIVSNGEQERSFGVFVEVDAGAGFRTIADELFQFPSVVCNQFLGDHGFTGLRGVRHPVSEGRLNYTCRTLGGDSN